MQKTFGKRMARLLKCLLFLLVIFILLYVENNVIDVSQYRVSNEKIPQSFDGYVIVQISDLHNKLFGKNQKRLMEKIKKEDPDLIVITGDLIDSNHPDVEKGLIFVEQAMQVAPVYFVTGNHDNWLSDTNTFQLFDGLEKLGAIVLRDEMHRISLGNGEEFICLMGIDDDTLSMKSGREEVMTQLEKEAQGQFSVLLAHEPQLFEEYTEHDIDLVLSGHAHGGQFRIPFIGGFVAPDQGFLPEYTEGLHEENGTSMIVSRGLGNSVVPQRLLNRPELVKITLECK